MPYQLRVWHRSGLAIWDVESPQHGWKVWANMVKRDSYYGMNTTTVKVVLAESPL